MKRLTERNKISSPSERTLQSVRIVMARGCDLVWQAGPDGSVTDVTPCRPAVPSGECELDESEVQRIEQLWRRCVRCAERFTAVYHVRRAGSSPHSYLIQAVPVLDARDEVLYWSGSAAEIDSFADAGSLFISEAATVLSSSLNRVTIVNRLVQASVDHFCDFCAIHVLDDDGSLRCEATAERRPNMDIKPEAMVEALEDAIKTRQPMLLLSAALRDPIDVKMHHFLRSVGARSMIVAPLSVGATCIGTLSFLESERSPSFAPRDVDVAVVVGRQLAMALENVKTLERQQRISERFRFMARVTGGLFTTLEQNKMLALVLDELRHGLADYSLAVSLTDGRLSVLASAGSKALLRDTAEGAIVDALRERRPILAGAISTLGHGAELRAGPLFESIQPRGWMMVPLYVGATVHGALICASNAHSYDFADLELFEEVGRRVSLALEHAESFARERRLIQTLQQATLPTRLATVQGASLSAIYRPAALEVQVGGDWYDAYDLDEHRVLLTVGDVIGHGLEASIVMGKLRHAINVVALYERDPVRILDAAERVLLRRYPESAATAFVAIFDSASHTITYANAGHPYPMLRRTDGSLIELKADGLPIGLRSARPPAKALVEVIHDAVMLVFYTDGLTEATRDMLAGERRLHEALNTDAVFFAESPADFIEQFCVGGKSHDDIAILALNFVEAERWAFDSGDWRAARRVRHKFLSRLSEWAEPGSDLKSAELIFGELAANVAQHAPGLIQLALEPRDGAAVLHIIDRGAGYAMQANAADLLTEHGRGLWLIQRLGAKLSVETLPGFGTHLRAVLPLRIRRP